MLSERGDSDESGMDVSDDDNSEDEEEEDDENDEDDNDDESEDDEKSSAGVSRKAAAAMAVGVGHWSDPDTIPGLAHFCGF